MATDASTATTPQTTTTPERSGRVLAVIVSFMMLVGVDSTIVNLALPDIQERLGFSTPNLSWVLNLYTLTFGGLLLLGGRLGDVYGRRNVFVAGVVIFTVASLLGGLATTWWWLLAARAGQGVGAALAAPSTMALIATNFVDQARARALAIFSAVMGAGASVGLIVGGLLTDLVSWRWVLLINVPFGIVIATLAPRLLKQPPTRPGRFDLLGATTATLGTGSLVYAFVRVASDDWGDTIARAAFGAAVVLLALFLVVETRVSQPLTPPNLLSEGTRARAYTMTLFLTGAMFSVLFLLSQYLQGVHDASPLQAGVAFLPMTLMQFAAVRLVPKLLPTLGARPLLLAGSLLIAGGMAWLSQLEVTSSYAAMVAVPLAMIGLGGGISFPTLNMTVLSGVPPQQSGAASGLLQTTQWLGGTLGLAVFVTVLGSATRDSLTHTVATSQQARHDISLTHGIATAFLAATIAAFVSLALSLPQEGAAVRQVGTGPARDRRKNASSS